MEKKNRKTLILSVIICLLPMILGSILYNKLPEQMPIHFTINNVPDNYANKNFALFIKHILFPTYTVLPSGTSTIITYINTVTTGINHSIIFNILGFSSVFNLSNFILTAIKHIAWTIAIISGIPNNAK